MTDVILIYGQRLEPEKLKDLKDTIGAFHIEPVDVNKSTVSEFCNSFYNLGVLHFMQAYLCEDIQGLSFLGPGSRLQPIMIFPNQEELLKNFDEYADIIRLSRDLRSQVDSVYDILAKVHVTAMNLNIAIDVTLVNEWTEKIVPGCQIQLEDAIDVAKKFYVESTLNLA